MSFKNNGLDNIIDALDELSEPQQVSFHTLFSDKFIKEHSKFSTLDELFQHANFSFETQEEFEDIPETELDRFVHEYTDFSS